MRNNKDKLIDRAILLRLLVRHYSHRIEEIVSSTLATEAAYIDGLDLISDVLNCLDCCEFVRVNNDLLNRELETLSDVELRRLFRDRGVTQLLVGELIRVRTRPMFVENQLSDDLAEVVTDTLRTVRGELT